MLKRKVDDEWEEFSELRKSLWRFCEMGEKEKHKKNISDIASKHAILNCRDCKGRSQKNKEDKK